MSTINVNTLRTAVGASPVLVSEIAKATDVGAVRTDLAAPSGSGLVGYMPAGVGAVARTLQDKGRESVSVKDFGAVGDGVVDDTAAIQLALSSTTTHISAGSQGGTFLIDGGLVSALAGRVIDMTGCTLKLKANATTKRMLNITGANTIVMGGIWDGNKANGNTPADLYSSCNIGINASGCTVRGVTSVNTAGMCVSGGSVNDTTLTENKISGANLYGLFLSSSVDAYRNRAIGNQIDMTGSGVNGQGILFTVNGGASGQYDWEISNNNVIGSQDAGIVDQAICLAVRGHRGIVANNVTRYGAMGWSEGGDNTLIYGNLFADLVGLTRYGVEVTGKNTVVSGNVITNALRGVIYSGNVVCDNLVISGNNIKASLAAGGIGIKLQQGSPAVSSNISITGNNITAHAGINPSGVCTGLSITGNTFTGPGSGVANSRGIYFEAAVVGQLYLHIQGNCFSKFERAYGFYSASALTLSDIAAIGNNVANDCTSSSITVSFSGSAVVGANIVTAWNITNGGAKESRLDVLGDVRYLFDTGNAEGLRAAGPGSIYLKTNHAGPGALSVKSAGLGNTGWTVPGESQSNTAAEIAAIANAVNTTGKYAGKQVWDTTNNRMMRSSGTTAAAVWHVLDGSLSVTPA